jgi:hypothetical protein
MGHTFMNSTVDNDINVVADSIGVLLLDETPFTCSLESEELLDREDEDETIVSADSLSTIDVARCVLPPLLSFRRRRLLPSAAAATSTTSRRGSSSCLLLEEPTEISLVDE